MCVNYLTKMNTASACSICHEGGHTAAKCPCLCDALKEGFFTGGGSGGGGHSHDDDDECLTPPGTEPSGTETPGTEHPPSPLPPMITHL